MVYEPLEPGVWTILATPFIGGRLEVDQESLRSLVEMYRRAGVTGLVALGVLGEAARLSSVGGEGFLRLSYAASRSSLREAIDRIGSALDRCARDHVIP